MTTAQINDSFHDMRMTLNMLMMNMTLDAMTLICIYAGVYSDADDNDDHHSAYSDDKG